MLIVDVVTAVEFLDVVSVSSKTLVALFSDALYVAVDVEGSTTGFLHVSGLLLEGDPQNPPYSSLTAFLGL